MAYFKSSDPLDERVAIRRVFNTLRVIVAVAIAAVFLYCRNQFCEAWLAMLIASGATVCGAFLGFLFGIPRSGQSNGEVKGYQPNTNLEEVSDWLTKIIIGVSLVELGDIQRKLNETIHSLTGSFSNGEDAYGFIWALLLFFFCYGLIGGYLITRIFLPRIFAKADQSGMVNVEQAQNIARDAAQEVIENQSQKNAHANKLIEYQLSMSGHTIPVEENDLREAIAGASQNVRSEIFFRARRFRMDLEYGTPAQRDLLTRVLPVFDALIADDERLNKPAQYHSNYAQRAFVLLHLNSPDFENARRALDKAIEVRDRIKDVDHKHYELCRAIANIGLWKFHFPDGKAYDAAIEADLRTAFTEITELYSNQHRAWILEWIKAKDIKDLPVPSEPTA